MKIPAVSEILRFDKLDPLMEKYPWQSLYTYCGSNPILFVDPAGDDEFIFDEKGYLQRVILNDDKKHKFRIVNEDGSYKDSEFSIASKDVDVSDNSSDHYSFKLNGDENGMNMYEFIVHNSNVEWSLLQTGQNEHGANYISTSHEEKSENEFIFLITRKLGKKTKYRNHIHNHNNGVNSPSYYDERKTGYNERKTGDMETGSSLLNYLAPQKINFFIYTFSTQSGKGELTRYYPGSKAYKAKIYKRRRR